MSTINKYKNSTEQNHLVENRNFWNIDLKKNPTSLSSFCVCCHLNHNTSFSAGQMYWRRASIFHFSFLQRSTQQLFFLPRWKLFGMCIVLWNILTQWTLIDDLPKACLMFCSSYPFSSFLECEHAFSLLVLDAPRLGLLGDPRGCSGLTWLIYHRPAQGHLFLWVLLLGLVSMVEKYGENYWYFPPPPLVIDILCVYIYFLNHFKRKFQRMVWNTDIQNVWETDLLKFPYYLELIL